jgi:hypothetical protein
MEGAAGRLPPSDFYKRRERGSSIYNFHKRDTPNRNTRTNVPTGNLCAHKQTEENQRLNTTDKEPRNLNKHCLSPCSPLERGFSKEA